VTKYKIYRTARYKDKPNNSTGPDQNSFAVQQYF